jgi:4-amino-4-deoxy-L-arabinose transferase-like glycosyltransferase
MSDSSSEPSLIPLKTAGALLLAALLLGGVTLAYPVGGWDIPTYSYVASVIREGGVPYRDAWDVKSPGIFFVHAAGQSLLGESPVAIRVFDVFWQYATSLLAAAAGVLVSGRRSVGLLAGLLYLLTYFARNLWDWAQPDSFAILPMLAAAILTIRALKSDRFHRWVVAGACVGVAAVLKPPLGLLGVPLLLAAAYPWPRAYTVGIRWVGLAVGLAIPLGACAAYFAAHGALPELWAAQFVLAPQHVARIHSYRSLDCLLRGGLQPVNAPIHALGLLAIGSVIAGRRRQRAAEPGAWLLWGLTATVLATVILHGKYDSMHFVPLLGPLAALGAPAVSQFWSQWRADRRWLAGIALLLVAATAVVPANKLRKHALYTLRSVRGQIPAAENPLRELGIYLRERTAPDDRIFVWGASPAVYYYAGRRSCSRFIHTYYLALDWKALDLKPLLLRDWLEHPPKYFVWMKDPAAPVAERPLVEFRCQPEDLRLGESYLGFEELRRRVAEGYRVEVETADYAVYVLRGPEERAP